MNSTPNYIDLPIVPCLGAGGVTVGSSLQLAESILGIPTTVEDGGQGFRLYKYSGLTLDVSDEVVHEVSVEIGYQGQTTEGAKPALKFQELKKIYPTLSFHDELRTWHVPGINGMEFDIVRLANDQEKKQKLGLIENRWVLEEYEVTETDGAFLYSIRINDIDFELEN